MDSIKLNALEKSVNEQLKTVDWEAAKLETPISVPNLDQRLYDDLNQLSKNDFEKAAKAWEEHAPKDTIAPTFVDRDWKKQIDETRQITDAIKVSERGPSYGVMTLDDKTVTSIRFEQTEKDGEKAFNVSFHLGNKTVDKLKGIDADTLANVAGDKNAKTIIEHGEAKGSLKGEELLNEYGITPEENERRAALKEARKAAEMIRSEEHEPDAPDEKNIVERATEKDREVIDGKEAVARANLLRQREREQFDREQEALGLKAESKSLEVENLSAKAVSQDKANDFAESRGDISYRDAQQLTEREKNRQVELMGQVHAQFRVAGAKFYFKDKPGEVALKDKGERMVSATNDDRVAKAMATMAEAKGWKTIKVSGHPDFKREVWMEANLRGIEARGYKPSEQDLKDLEAKRERAMLNTVEHDKTTRERKTVSARESSPAEATRNNDKAAAGQTIETVAKAAVRAYAGKVLEHGVAPYNHDPKEKPNYFVKMQTDKGEETVWGVDLKRAMTESKVKAGDDVKLQYQGKTPVTVESIKRDQAGKAIGSEKITVNRNQWNVQKSEKAQVAEAVASALIDAKVKDPAQREALKAAVGARIAERDKENTVPAIAVYDKKAPAKSQQQERTGPVVERNAERTR